MKRVLLFFLIISITACATTPNRGKMSLDQKIEEAIFLMKESKHNHGEVLIHTRREDEVSQHTWAMNQYDIVIGCLELYQEHRPAVKQEVQQSIGFLEAIAVTHKVDNKLPFFMRTNSGWFNGYCVDKYGKVVMTLKECREKYGVWEWTKKNPHFRR